MKTKTVSNNFDTIWYHGYEFDVRFVTISHVDSGAPVVVMVGTEEFQDNYLLNKFGDFADKEAEKLDSEIACYVPEQVLKTYSDEDFQKYVNEQFD